MFPYHSVYLRHCPVDILRCCSSWRWWSSSWSCRSRRSFHCCCRCCLSCMHCCRLCTFLISSICFWCWRWISCQDACYWFLPVYRTQDTSYALISYISQMLTLQCDSGCMPHMDMPSNNLLPGRDLCFINTFVNATSLLDMFLIMCWLWGFWIAWNFWFAYHSVYLRHIPVDTLSCCSSWWCLSSRWCCRSLRSFRCCCRCCLSCMRRCRRVFFSQFLHFFLTYGSAADGWSVCCWSLFSVMYVLLASVFFSWFVHVFLVAPCQPV